MKRSKVQSPESKVQGPGGKAFFAGSGPGTRDPGPGTLDLSSGFTLLEVMIALAIVAIALVTLLALGNRSIGIHARLQRMTQATLLAQRQMTAVEIRERASKSEPQAEEGTFEPPFEGYRWRTAYEETPVPSVRMVTVTVAWGDEARNERVDLNSFIFR